MCFHKPFDIQSPTQAGTERFSKADPWVGTTQLLCISPRLLCRIATFARLSRFPHHHNDYLPGLSIIFLLTSSTKKVYTLHFICEQIIEPPTLRPVAGLLLLE
jgi:hypothetical protein